MSVYFDYKVKLNSVHEVVTVGWHSQLSLLGVALNTEEPVAGGVVYICDELVGTWGCGVMVWEYFRGWVKK